MADLRVQQRPSRISLIFVLLCFIQLLFASLRWCPGASQSFAVPPSISALPGSAATEQQPVVTALGVQSRILLVGASRGIGREFVRQLLQRGCDVIATHREEKPPETLQSLEDLNKGKLSYLRLDVNDAASIASAAELLATEGCALTHIIHNAGVYGPTVSLDGKARNGRPAAPPVTKEAMLQTFEVNAVGPLLVVQQFLPLLKAASEGQLPVISILTSKVGSVDDNGSGGAYAYRASKSACNIIAKSLYCDLRADNLATVVLLHPGYVRTDMTNRKGLIDVEESVSGLLKAIEATGPETPFRWVDYKANLIPW
eukprot:TRINITY_DN28263_c0_g1_i1.p1 TRINITY_DN28263_c0_g1~~TRINITY_DN28263_c0_g1_i1.p1  ORF type:complete len:314 (-),score=56.02 TRINITY_DN28263_c0_g1_i1:160-1101(-)